MRPQRLTQLLAALIMAAPHIYGYQTQCQLELGLDHHPEQVAWELRTDSTFSLLDERNYGDYTQPQQLVRENWMLESDETYHLVLVDQGENGIQNGSLTISCKFGAYDKIVLHTVTSDYQDGQVFSFQVQPPASQRKPSGPSLPQQPQGSSSPQRLRRARVQ